MAADIEAIESMKLAGRSVDVRLSEMTQPGGDRATRLTVYMRGGRLVLSEVMPILENAGLRVLSMNPYEAQEDDGTTYIYDFAVQDASHAPIDLKLRGPMLARALLAAVVEAARAAGAPAVEAYPIDPVGRRANANFAFVGIASMFDRAGFERVLTTAAHSDHLPRLLVRLDLAQGNAGG